MSQVAEIKGLKELISRMQAYPLQLARTLAVGVSASLNIFWENTPPYPRQKPETKYRRTGTLGRSLGSSETGGATGQGPSVYRIRKMGEGNMEGVFGTKLDYAPYVIGDTMQAKQNSHWWRMQDIAVKSQEKIKSLWNGIAVRLANFLEGRGA